MSTKWDVATFVESFMNQKLGRKHVFGSYRVLDGDNCKLLVKSSYTSNQPTGNSLIAIDLSTDNVHLVFFHQYNSQSSTYSVNRLLRDDIAQKMLDKMFSGDDDNLLSSGIIDINESFALIEMGDTPYLLHRKVDGDGTEGHHLQTTSLGCPMYSHAMEVPSRVATIAEAQELTKQPEGQVDIVGTWWASAMPLDFTPPPFNPGYVKTLSTALNPIDYGFTLNECYIASATMSKMTIHLLAPKDEILENQTNAPHVKAYVAAKKTWDKAKQAHDHRHPGSWEGVTCFSSRFARQGSNSSTSGEIIVTNEGTYVRGTLKALDNFNHEWPRTKAGVWYKLTAKSGRIQIT